MHREEAWERTPKISRVIVEGNFRSLVYEMAPGEFGKKGVKI